MIGNRINTPDVTNITNVTSGLPSDSVTLRKLSDDTLETAQTGVEYYSPEQHGGIYGVIVRQYFTTTLPGDLTSGNNVAALINFNIYAVDGSNNRMRLSSYSASSPRAFIYLDGASGDNNLILSASSMTMANGWVNYIKA